MNTANSATLPENMRALTHPTRAGSRIGFALRRFLPLLLLLSFCRPSQAVEYFSTGDNSWDYHTSWGGDYFTYGNTTKGGIYFNDQPETDVYSRNWFIRLVDNQNALNGAMRIARPDWFPDQPLLSLDCTFDFLCFLGTGADGFSFNFGKIPDALPNTADPLEAGYGGGLSVSFHYWTTNPTYGSGKVKVRWNGTYITEQPVDYDLYDGGYEHKASRCHITVTPTSGGQATMTVTVFFVDGITGATSNSKTIVDNKTITFNPAKDWEFGLAARTGGANSRVYLGRFHLNGSMAPFLGDITASTSDEGAKFTKNLPVSDPDGNASITATSDNPTLTGAITVSGSKLSFTPGAGKYGSATITVSMTASGTTSTKTFTHTIADIDRPPTLGSIGNVAIKMNKTEATPVSLSGISAGDGDVQAITVTASSSNKSLLPDPTVEYTTPNSFGTLKINPLRGQFGESRITVTVRDQGGLSVQQNFTVNVAAPTFAVPSNQTYAEDTGPFTVNVTGIDDGDPESSQTMTLTATSSLPELVQNPTVTFDGTSTRASLLLTLKPNANSDVFGAQPAVITLELKNADGATKRATFNVKVTAVADAPLAGMSRGIDFAGTGAAIGGDPSLAGKSFTLELWTKRNAAGHLDPMMSHGTNGMFFGFQTDNKVKFGFLGAAGEGLVSAAPYTDNSWHHWAATYDVITGKRKMYRDGILLIEDTVTASYDVTGSFYLGGSAGAAYFNGVVQEARLWQSARTIADILRWQTTPLIATTQSGLLGYWRANEGIWPRLENLGSLGDKLDGTLLGTISRIEGLANLQPVLVPEKSKSYQIPLPAFNPDTSGESQLTYQIVSTPSNGTLGTPSGGYVTYTPRTGYGGDDLLSYRVINGSVSSETVVVNLRMEVINDPPTVSVIPNQVVYDGTSGVSVPFTIQDEETAAAALTVSAASSDTLALPNSALTLGGTGANRTLTIASQPGVYASSVVTVTVTDGANSVMRTFTVQLSPSLAYRIIAIPGPTGSQVTSPRTIDNDGRIGGWGDTLGGGVPRAFVNLGYLSGFSPQTGFLEQNNARVNDLGTANGLRVSVGEYYINNTWHAFLHNGSTLTDLGVPTGSSGSYALGVSSDLKVVGYSIAAGVEKAFLSSGQPDAYTDISPVTPSRAVGINTAGAILIRSGANGGYRAWLRPAGGGSSAEILPPSGYANPNPISLTDDGVILAELTSGSNRKLGRYSAGAWTLLDDSQSRWSWFSGGQINDFGISVGTGRPSAAGTASAVLNSSGKWYKLGDLIPADSGWTLDTADAINRDGMIVGTGRQNGVTSAYIAVPACVIGQRVPRPNGAIARYPMIQIIEGSVGDDESSSFFWSELEKNLYAIRPVTARLRWFITTDMADTNNVTIATFAANIWPKQPYIHVANVPVDVEPVTDGADYRFALLDYSTDREAGVDPSTKKFNSASTNAYSVLHFLKTDGRQPDPLFQTNAFLVVRTLGWSQSPLYSETTATVGTTLTHTNHTDYDGKNGYLYFTNTVVDVYGEQASYKRSDRSGSLNVVNTFNNAHNGNPSLSQLLVVWYEMTPFGVALPNRPVIYQTSWPTNSDKIIIASGKGNNFNGTDPITSTRYPEAHLYVQPDPAQPGFNPNEEHALLAPSDQGQAIYALRNDLNGFRRYSEPFCLLKYKDSDTELWHVKLYQIVAEQSPWFFRYTGDAGKEIQPPIPLSLMPLSSRSYVSSGDWFQDYNAKVYARAAGPDGTTTDFVLRWYYPLQPGFFYDLNGDGVDDATVGSSIPWLDRRSYSVNGERSTAGTPVPVVYNIRWPDVPVLQVGQTLTTPVNGLPDVRNMANVRVIYDTLDPRGTNGLASLARLFDPISERYVKLGSSFVLSSAIKTATDSRGRAVFVDLPYALRVRLSFDPFNKWLYFGAYEDRTSIGEPLVLPNILTGSERDTVLALAANATGTQKSNFEAGVMALYNFCRNPNQLDLDGNVIPDTDLLVGLVYGTNVSSKVIDGSYRTVTNAVPEIFSGNPKALTAADASVPPALPHPGNALVMPSGSSQYLRIDNPKGTADATGNAPGLNGSFTIEFWLKPGAGSTATNTLVRLGTNPLNALKAGYRNGYFYFEFATQRVRTLDPILSSDMNAWHHYALVFDADAQTAAIYRDSVAIAFAEGFAIPLKSTDLAPLYFGGDPGSPAQVYAGMIDEIRLWDGIARHSSTLAALSRKQLAIGQDGLAGYWRFDTAAGRNVPDDSLSGHPGQLLANGSYSTPTDAPYGIPPRYITLAENNDPTLGGLPVTLKIIEIDDGPYLGDLKVLPSDNVFDSRLILRHSSDFAGRTDSVEFEWWYHPYDSDSRINLPRVNPITGNVTDTRGYIRHSGGLGLNQITLGGPGESGLLVLSDNWFVLRVRGYNVNGNTNWSDWIGDPSNKSEPAAMLAEGWVKRVIRGLNPFDARSTDFNSAQASTVVSMLQQAGSRYEGDIAFNPDPSYLNSIGLIEAYQTVLNRGIGLSIEGVPSVNYAPANQALLMAASRIADLYSLLGNDAMADAADPTIGFTTSSDTYGATASSIFAFQNQLDSLLEEELTLLRGRDNSSAGVQGAPVYNRLLWNFTLGDGEVAYTQVYNVSDLSHDGKIDEKDARMMYPQGHGDAWGHYLTAIKGYYSLLRHPNYTWLPRSESVLLAGVPVKVDYLDERKFAAAAANKAKAGAQIVDLTYRQKYVDNPAGQWQGYTDTDSERAWGVSEWSQRAAAGAYFDWVVGNAILPSQDPDDAHTGIDRIDRQTVDELSQIGSEAFDIVAQVDKADNGLNPLGLVAGAVPFDIDPAEVAAGKTHFEQVAGRAQTALLNARTLFDEANAMTMALRKSEDAQEDLTKKNLAQERELDNRLIEIYGYPYAGDIGAGKTYPSGYSGPDLIHYLYVETADVNGETAPPDQRMTAYHQRLNEAWVETTGVFEKSQYGPMALDFNPLDHLIGIVSLSAVQRHFDSAAKIAGDSPPSIEAVSSVPIDYPTSSQGYAFKAPAEWGLRRAGGEIQTAIQNLVMQQARFKQSIKNYENLVQEMDEKINGIQGEKHVEDTELRVFDQKLLQGAIYKQAPLAFRKVADLMTMGADKLEKIGDASAECLPKSVGLATDATAPARGLIKNLAAMGSSLLKGMAWGSKFYADNIIPMQAEAADQLSDRMLLLDKVDADAQSDLKQATALMREEPVKRLEMFNQREALDQAGENVRASIAKGQRVLDERRTLRTAVAGDATKLRYRDMAFRMFRNEALGKFRAQFDLAARYVYLAATAYDYEVNLLGKGANSGSQFLTDIIRQRTLGQLRVDATGVAPVAGRVGLADPLARMIQNFSVQKTQMGFNNPQTETGRFSLRKEWFRLRSHSNDDWRKVLKSAIVPNVWDLPEFRRYCRPFAPESSGAQPGLVIRFPTTVTFGLNFFGWPLGGGDSAYDPSHFATRVRSAGIWFSDYDGNGMSMTPRVYLVPVGADVLRAQDGNDFETRLWRVVDQKLPVPYQIGPTEIKNPNYIPANDSLGGAIAEIRKFSSFRAFHDSGSFTEREAITDSRLIGRSVWNTEWMLIIPGGTLLNDPNVGLDAFINTVSDIKLFFQTYAYSGN